VRFMAGPRYIRLNANFQFSLWDSWVTPMLFGFSLGAFNSLCEIHRKWAYLLADDAWLSILFVRFSSRITGRAIRISWTFNSLCEIHNLVRSIMSPSCLLSILFVRFRQRAQGSTATRGFQFSLWDSWLSEQDYPFENQIFQFSLWDSLKTTWRWSMPDFCFQFSLWDSLDLLGENTGVNPIFQFSLWDS